MRRAPTFTPGDSFGTSVRVAAHDHLASQGVAARGGLALWVTAAVMGGWFLASYAALVWLPLELPLVVLGTVSIGVAAAGLGMAVKHDAVHHHFSDRPGVNRMVARVGTFYGLTAGWWRQKHNRLHHGYTGIDGFDPDIDLHGMARLSFDQRWRRWHRWQHLYLWALYPFLHLAQVAGDLSYAITGRIGHHQVEQPSLRRSLARLVEKLGGVAVLLGVALWFHPAVSVLAVALGVSMVGGFVLAVVFITEHTVDESTFPASAEGRLPVGWAEAQVRSSANVATGNRLLTWYVGGLNLHIEHHLCPRIAHTQLHRVAPVVRQHCRDHGLPYREYPTLRAALAAHQRYLRQLGAGPRAQLGTGAVLASSARAATVAR